MLIYLSFMVLDNHHKYTYVNVNNKLISKFTILILKFSRKYIIIMKKLCSAGIRAYNKPHTEYI